MTPLGCTTIPDGESNVAKRPLILSLRPDTVEPAKVVTMQVDGKGLVEGEAATGDIVAVIELDGVCVLEPVILGDSEQESATDIPESEQAPEQGHGIGVLIPLLGQ